MTIRAADEKRRLEEARAQLQVETMSQTTSNYGNYSRLKNKKKQKDLISSLPTHIGSNLDAFQFGICTMPSDNMGMVMTNEFGNDFARKMVERAAIEKELGRIAGLQAKNAKHNIYMTKTQALRDADTLGAMR